MRRNHPMQYATMNPQKRKLDHQEQKEADVTLESRQFS